jgi:DNA-binding MarR family transcriptional regulator
MLARKSAELMYQAVRLAQGGDGDTDLNPAEWTALRYLARANQTSRTPSALAKFQATTRGTTSQVIKALENGGYLVRLQSKTDKRNVNLSLTDKGRQALARDPFDGLIHAVGSLEPEAQETMHVNLLRVLGVLAPSGTCRFFGTCRDCILLRKETDRDQFGVPHPTMNCRFSGILIEEDEADLLCVNFLPQD